MGGMFALHNKTTENLASDLVPERELLLAVLDRCVLDYHGTNLKLKAAANEWLFEEEPQDVRREFSFPWICEFLGLEKSRLRDCIRALDLSGKAPQGHRWLRKKVKSVEPAYAA
jgi:hypothetical protein